jgi:hypothetical protein
MPCLPVSTCVSGADADVAGTRDRPHHAKKLNGFQLFDSIQFLNSEDETA